MNIISGIGESGFLAHSAFSAGIATKDSNGNDITATYLTGVDLTPYQTVEGMTAYQPAGSYLTTADSANFYTTANESGYINAVPDTYLQNTDLSTSDGKVTAISGIPLSAGSDVPEGVMVESGLEYNAVNEISAYNGSAIAQYGAEKQWLQHDDTLVHASNSAQYALGVNLSAVAQLLGVDETVLFSSTNTVKSANLSESITAFKRMGVMLIDDHQCERYIVADTNYPYAKWFSNYGFDSWNLSNTAATLRLVGWSANDDKITCITGWQKNCNYTASNVTWNAGQTGVYGNIKYVIGIGRKQ